MKKLMILAVAVMTLALAGCVQVKMDSTIDKNGGGTYSLEYSVSTEVEQALKEMATLGSEMGEMPDLFDMKRADLEKSLQGTGNKLVKFDDVVSGDRHTLTMVIEYQDVNALSGTMEGLMGTDGGEMAGFGVVRHGDDYLLHSIETVDVDEEIAAEAEEAPESMEDLGKAMENAQKSMELMGRLMAHASELNVTMRITFPSQVLEHNAHRLEGNTCIWEINSSTMMASQGIDPRVVFKGDGVKIKTAD